MKALTTLKSAIGQSSFFGIIALISLFPVVLPYKALAAELQTSGSTKAAVFEINVSDPSLLNSAPKQNSQNSLSIDTVSQADPLVNSLDAYLTDKGSPLAGFASQMVKFPHWERALSISVVESNMCIHTPMVKTKQGWIESHNCSGIVAGNSYHIYNSYMDWFSGLNDLLDQPNYINRPIEKFIGYYVVPGSFSWLWGVKKTESDLADMEKHADMARKVLAQKAIFNPIGSTVTTFPELAINK